MTFLTSEIKGKNRNLMPAFFHTLNDQIIVIACPACTSGLRFKNCDMLKVNAGLSNMCHYIAYYIHRARAIRRINKPERILRHSFILRHNCKLISAIPKSRDKKLIVIMEHIGHVDRMRLFHFRCKNSIIFIHFNSPS